MKTIIIDIAKDFIEKEKDKDKILNGIVLIFDITVSFGEIEFLCEHLLSKISSNFHGKFKQKILDLYLRLFYKHLPKVRI